MFHVVFQDRFIIFYLQYSLITPLQFQFDPPGDSLDVCSCVFRKPIVIYFDHQSALLWTRQLILPKIHFYQHNLIFILFTFLPACWSVLLCYEWLLKIKVCCCLKVQHPPAPQVQTSLHMFLLLPHHQQTQYDILPHSKGWQNCAQCHVFTTRGQQNPLV